MEFDTVDKLLRIFASSVEVNLKKNLSVFMAVGVSESHPEELMMNGRVRDSVL